MKHKENFIENGNVYMVRCEVCDRENWAPSVATGVCHWCGHSENLKRRLIKIVKGE